MLKAVTKIDITVTVEVLVILFLDLGVDKYASWYIFIISSLFFLHITLQYKHLISPGVRLCSDTNSRKTCTEWTLGNKKV